MPSFASEASRSSRSPFQPEVQRSEQPLLAKGRVRFVGEPVAAGLAAAARKDEIDKRIYVIIGDGEAREGQIAEALDFIAFATEPRRLAEQAGYVAYGPARRSAAALVAKDIQPHLPTEEANAANALRINYAWWVENGPRIERRFADWIEQERFVYEFQAPDSH